MLSFAWILGAILFVFAGSQIYWLRRARAWFGRIVPGRRARIAVESAVLAAYLLLLVFNFGVFGRRPTSTRLTLYDALVDAPFAWWAASSMLAFLIAIVLGLAGRTGRLFTRRRGSSPAAVSPGRRQFLESAATATVAAPFVAGAYGLLYGRLNLQTTTQRIRLTRLPKAFHGFRIAQLSDVHIGPFMTEEQIRKYVRIANALKPDLVALTGDFLTWDPLTQRAVVAALAGLQAPFGVYGCLGNHETWSKTEDSITRLFAQVGIRILRQERTSLVAGGENLNLIGVDFGSRRHYLAGVESLVAPDTANILLSHNPDTFDRAAALGIDLSLAGHTHGGQLALEFVSPEIAPSRLMTPYVAGWFEKPGGQLYVNRGIGTIGVPMRVGAPPEITIFELGRSS